MANIKIEYDGAYPCLCMGHLKVWIDDKLWDFGKYALSPGGHIERDDEWNMWAESGEWAIWDDKWPEGFPEDMKDEEISWGCCGGCI